MIEFRRDRKRQADVDLTPLIDVVFQLLVFFMLTSAFINPGINVELPDVKTGESGDEATVSISIDDAGKIFLGKTEVTMDGLRSALEAKAGADREVTVAIWGDVQVSYGLFMRVMDLCRAAGLRNVVLMVNRESLAPAAPK
jgi:biopolymer transport protein ExbD